MPDFLEFTFDKFTFRVATDRWYSVAGVWARPEGQNIIIGITDFLQQRSGDVAFAEVKPAGTLLKYDDEAAVIETIKVDISLGSPVIGRVVATNPALEASPEVINQDPYGAGWLASIQPDDWAADRARLLTPQDYFKRIQQQAQEEARQP